MRMAVDKQRCSGHGRCASFAPNVFELDDSGFNTACGQSIEVAKEEEQNAMRGLKSCPERAISIVEP